MDLGSRKLFCCVILWIFDLASRMSWNPRDPGSCQAVLPSYPADVGFCFRPLHITIWSSASPVILDDVSFITSVADVLQLLVRPHQWQRRWLHQHYELH